MKNALITGANKGIGYEVARELAARGFRVFVSARNVDAGRAAVERLKKAGGTALFLHMDVADAASVAAAAREVEGLVDCLDVLANNAGVVLEGDSGVLSMAEDLFRKTLETNTFGPWRVAKAFLPLLKRSAAPRIINMSSGGGQLTDGADGWAPAYCISKTALNGVTAQLATALPEFAVNSVCPGWVRTDMGGSSAPRSVQEGADTVVWLATDAPQDLSGKFLRDRVEIAW